MKVFTKILAVIAMCMVLLCACGKSRNDAKTTGTNETKSPETPVTNNETMGTEQVTKPENELPNEAQMLRDISAKEVFSPYDELDSLEITKRQTRLEDYSDKVYVMVKSHTSATERTSSLILTYGLYNEGWSLDGVETDYDGENYSRATAGADDSEIEILFQMHNAKYAGRIVHLYDNWEIQDKTVNLDKQETLFAVHAQKDCGMWNTDEYYYILYYFNPDGGWETHDPIDDSENYGTIDMSRLIGYYSGRDSRYNQYVDLWINDIDAILGYVTLKCKYSGPNSESDMVWEGTYQMNHRGDTWCDAFEVPIDEVWRNVLGIPNKTSIYLKISDEGLSLCNSSGSSIWLS